MHRRPLPSSSYLDERQTPSNGCLLIVFWARGSLFSPFMPEPKLAMRESAAKWMARVQRQTELRRPAIAPPLSSRKCEIRVPTRRSSAATVANKGEPTRLPAPEHPSPHVRHQASAAKIHVARAIPRLGRVHTTDDHSPRASTSISPRALVPFTSLPPPHSLPACVSHIHTSSSLSESLSTICAR